MKKGRRYTSFILLAIVFLVLWLPAYAHSGRTDADGGHYDSSTGAYHYHHGRPAHEHPDGVCPYAESEEGREDKREYVGKLGIEDIDDELENEEEEKKEKSWISENIVYVVIYISIFLYFLYAAVYAIKRKIFDWRRDGMEEKQRTYFAPFIGCLVICILLGVIFAVIYTGAKNKIETLQADNEAKAAMITELEAKKTELEAVNKKIDAVKKSSFIATAGEYSIPEDIAPGRYKVTRVEESGNDGKFYVYNGEGENRIDVRFGEAFAEYTCNLYMDDFIRTGVKLRYDLIE